MGNRSETKADKKDKTLFTGKPVTPFLEVIVLGAFVFITAISIKKYLADKDPNWIYLILVGLTALTLFGLLFNYTNKTLILTKKKIRIKRWLFGQSEFNIEDIKGYDLKEEYDRSGIVKNLRVWINDDKHIVFTNVNYRNIYFLVSGLKRSGIPFLGTVVITSKYKNLITWLMITAGAISTIGFLLFQMMKLMK
ncbi:hypothetical protein [uncultured Algoriphagus sp.]|uniref:hypothetical protein n=1 Tax=uncultured Algoriphagus sp. TaxID=417365 RepID=UPI00258A0CEB|nr:hypothetical protein [uncultured Algoriphagus sp.]